MGQAYAIDTHLQGANNHREVFVAEYEPRGLAKARQFITRELGTDVVQELHRPRLLNDAWILAGWPAVNIALLLAMARLPIGPAFAACFVLQGIRLTWYLEVPHDLFIHRRLGGKRLAAFLGLFYLAPVLYPFTGFSSSHLRHHYYVGTKRDPESPIINVNTFWKRLAFLTWPGFKVGTSGFSDPEARFTPAFLRRVRFEQWFLRFYLLALFVLAALWRPFLYGYLLPFFVVSPIANAFRVMLEHGEANPENAFHAGTFYRAGFWISLLFPGGVGDRHIMHHLFPGIPMYRLGEAAALISPILARNGVRERRSLLQLLKGYFVEAQPHRTLWTDVIDR
jgi:fatty acid desaturase